MAITFKGSQELHTSNHDFTPLHLPTHEVDDFLLACCHRHNEGVSEEVWQDNGAGSNGWTRLLTAKFTSGTDMETGIYYKKATSTNEALPTFSVGTTNNKNTIILITCWKGVDTSTPIDATLTQDHTDNTQDPTPPAITTATDGAVVLLWKGSGGTKSTSQVPPSGFVKIEKDRVKDNRTVAMGWKTQASAGTVTPGAWDNTSTGTNQENHCVTMALRPASGITDKVVQVTHSHSKSGENQAVSSQTSWATPTSGNLLVVGIYRKDSESGTTTHTVTDSGGTSSWTKEEDLASNSQYASQGALFWKISDGDESTITADWDESDSSAGLIAMEVDATAITADTTSVGSTSGSSTTVTLTAANADIFVGMSVAGTGVASGATVAAISGTTLTLSIASTIASSTTLTFTGTRKIILSAGTIQSADTDGDSDPRSAPTITQSFDTTDDNVYIVGFHGVTPSHKWVDEPEMDVQVNNSYNLIYHSIGDMDTTYGFTLASGGMVIKDTTSASSSAHDLTVTFADADTTGGSVGKYYSAMMSFKVATKYNVTSGAISLGGLRTFLEDSSTIALGDLYEAGSLVQDIDALNDAVPNSGTISLSNLYGVWDLT